MSDKDFSEGSIFSMLSKEWRSFEQIVGELNLEEEYARRWVAIKIKNMERSGDIKVETIGGIKFWKVNWLIELDSDYEFQIKKYEELLEKDSSDYQALFKLAKIYEEKGDYKQASNHFRKCVALNNNEPDATFGLIRTYYKSGKVSDAYKLLKKQKQVPTAHSNFASYITLDVGYNYLKEGNEEKAIDKFYKAIEYEYENDDAYYELGLIYFKRKDFKEAVKNFRFALEFGGEEIPNDQGIKRWICYTYAMQEIDALSEALDLFELTLASVIYDIEYWECLVDIWIKFDLFQRGIVFLENFIQKEIDEKIRYDEYDKNVIVDLQNVLFETYLNKIVQEALSFYFSVSSDCLLKDLQEYIRKKQSFLVMEDSDLKIRVIEVIQTLQLPIVFKEGKFHSTKGKYSQEVQPKHGSKLLIINSIGNKIHQLLPSPSEKNIKKFGKEIGRFTIDFNDFEKFIVSNEIIAIMKAWDELKPKVWKKIIKEVAKYLPALIFP